MQGADEQPCQWADIAAGACERVSTVDQSFRRCFSANDRQVAHRWLIKRRVEIAKEMLLSSELPLSGIALECGFADQSHLTETFTVMVGAPPEVWRRVHRN